MSIPLEHRIQPLTYSRNWAYAEWIMVITIAIKWLHNFQLQLEDNKEKYNYCLWLKIEVIGRVRPTLLPPTETISILFCLGFSYLLFRSHKDQLVLNSPRPPRWPPVLLDFTGQVLGLQLGSTAPSLRWLPFRKLLHLHEEPRSYSHPAGCKPLRTNVRLFHQSLRSTWLRTGLTHSLEDPLYTVILIFKTL